MALDLPPPRVPGLDQYGVLDLEKLNNEALRTICQATTAAKGLWLHAYWHGTTRNGEKRDWFPDSRELVEGDEEILVEIPYLMLIELDQGHAVLSYTVQPTWEFEHDYPESLRVNILVGFRHFPGAGLTVASIREAHRLQFDASGLDGRGAMAAIPPWQAMQAGDKVFLSWQGIRDNGGNIPEFRADHEVVESEVGLPVGFEIPYSNIALIRNGTGVLSYSIEYKDGGNSASPTQSFAILPAPADRLPMLRILEHTGGGPIDPGLVSNGLTFRIAAYPELQEGDSLIISIEDTANHQVEFITGIRLDRSSVDSGLLEATLQGDWLEDYLDRNIALRYQVARPGMGQGGEPLVLAVRATMKLPLPVVDGASGAGEAQGEFKAGDTKDGIRVRVPSKAVYPADAQVQMHWEGFAGTGSEIVTVSDGARPPSFLISPNVVASNIGKVVKVFYRVTANGDAPRDSEVFSLKVLPIPSNGYPTLQSTDAVNGELQVARLGSSGALMSVAPWPLIALGQLLTISAMGTLRTGIVETNEFVKARRVTNTTAPVQAYLSKEWLLKLKPDSTLELTVSVTADGGETSVLFPRVYFKIIAPTL
ncbi:hypothetical protein [Pseudomonas baltica]|uniref:hypothetical protein n=1 Tax=Pseudomonas baltica TaxID=2762576 RepID=UPI00289A43BF|nr:hypothetical protein [Pseudomonas baltica]